MCEPNTSDKTLVIQRLPKHGLTQLCRPGIQTQIFLKAQLKNLQLWTKFCWIKKLFRLLSSKGSILASKDSIQLFESRHFFHLNGGLLTFLDPNRNRIHSTGQKRKTKSMCICIMQVYHANPPDYETLSHNHSFKNQSQELGSTSGIWKNFE